MESGPPQELRDGWVRVAVRACGLCGTDLHLFSGMDLPRGATYPVRPGHEVAGVVLESASSEIGAGEDVVLHPLLPCGQCQACRSGHENRCRTAKALGIDIAGGVADEVVWPASRLVRCEGVDPAFAAILCDAVATAHHALMRANLPPGGALTVIGTGGVGGSILQLARVLDPDAQLTAVVRSQASADRIARMGMGIHVVLGLQDSGRRILAEKGPQDAVIEFGPGALIAGEAFPMLGRGGRLIFGSINDDALALPTTVTALVTRELEIMGTYASTIDDLRAVVQLARGGRLELEASVSHRFALDQAAKAFELLRDHEPGMARIVVLP
jgi:D-arabinose 1-dehydrogenase-like Zn-dependent alcohol dehydrogenase